MKTSKTASTRVSASSKHGVRRFRSLRVADALFLGTLSLRQIADVLIDRLLRSEVTATDLDTAAPPNESNVSPWPERALVLVDHAELTGSKLVHDELGDSVGDPIQEDVGGEVMLLFHPVLVLLTSRPVNARPCPEASVPRP